MVQLCGHSQVPNSLLQDGNLTERSVLLNDRFLELTPDDQLPDFEPIVSGPSSTLTIPGSEIVFWVFEDPKIGKLCKFV